MLHQIYHVIIYENYFSQISIIFSISLHYFSHKFQLQFIFLFIGLIFYDILGRQIGWVPWIFTFFEIYFWETDICRG